MKPIRMGLILAWVGLLFLVLTACSPIVELPIEEPVNPIDELAENLQLSEEQLQKLEEGTGTMQLREEQVDIIREPIEQFLNDTKQLLSETRWQEVKDILDTVLTEHEADLQQLGRAVEDIYESLNAQAEVEVHTNFEKLSGSYSSPKILSTLPEGSQYSIVYTPKYSEEGQEDFRSPSVSVIEHGSGGESIPSANDWSGAVGVYSNSLGFGAAQATALQRIMVEVPVDNSDVTIKATIRYHSGAVNFPPTMIAGASITKRGLDGGLLHDVIDPLFGWEDAIETALTIIPIPADDIAKAIKLLEIIHDLDEVISFNEALRAGGTEKTITYSANSVDKGSYAFGIGFRTETTAVLGVATAFVFGQVPKITVTITSPTTPLPTVTINSPSDGSSFTKDETINFQGSATDPEDGNLTGSSLVWTSSIDGQIGIGESFTRDDLSVGTHTITLTATDSDGNFGTANITITIRAQNVEARIDSYSPNNPNNPAEVTVGDSTTIRVTFTNTGNTAWQFIAGATVWDSNGNVVGNYESTLSSSLQPDQQETVSWNHPVNNEGDYWLQFGVWKDTPYTSENLLDKEPSPSERLIIGTADEEQPVNFPDPNLEQAIREAIDKPTGDIYPSDLEELTELDANDRRIEDLTGIEYCVDLQLLNLGFNDISDITPLANLTSLTGLELYVNDISDITPLSNLTSLTRLKLGYNDISDITPLANLTSLTGLGLEDNDISDIQPLVKNAGLGDGDWIFIWRNYLDLSEGSDDMQNIQTLINRGAEVDYEPQKGAGPTMLWGEDSGSNLLKIDPNTGTGTFIGPIGFSGVTDIAFTPDGKLYGITFNQLLQIDPSTGEGTAVGPPGLCIGIPEDEDVNALVARADGTLLAASFGGKLLSIDPNTGCATIIGDLDFHSSGDLAFAPDGRLFAAADGNPDALYLVDPNTGASTLIGSIGYYSVFGLAFSSDGQLYGASSVGPKLIKINPNTGAGEEVGTITNTNGSMWGLTRRPIS